MADRPRNGGPEDGPEFDWLYGKQRGTRRDPSDATRPVPKQGRPTPAPQRPDATRVMPVQQRPASGGKPPTPPPIAPPPGGSGGSGPGRRRLRFRPRYLGLLLLAWLLFLVLVPVFSWQDVNKIAFEPDGDRPADQPGTTYLLVGTDSRAGLSKEERKELGTGNAAGSRTDTIMVLHTGSGPNLLMSIPRDSLVEVPGYGETKINAAFAYGGPELLVQTVEQASGIRIDEYAEIGMGGVVSLVDAVGGIEVCPKQDMVDKLANLDIKKGCQEVDGKTALAYARSRHVAATGDIDRARRQREVISAVGSKAASPMSVINPLRYWRLNHALPDSFAFGEGAGPIRAGMWAWAMTKVDGESGLTCGVPISDLAVHWDSERAPQMFQAIIDDDTESITDDLCSPSGLPASVTGGQE